jgi:hypothetical protein
MMPFLTERNRLMIDTCEMRLIQELTARKFSHAIENTFCRICLGQQLRDFLHRLRALGVK